VSLNRWAGGRPGQKGGLRPDGVSLDFCAVAPPKRSEFLISVHRDERIIEVVYPSQLDEAGYARYDQDIRRAVTELGGQWDCLVDQRALAVAPPELTDRIAGLNRWAREHGMRRTARVVKDSAIAELQVRRIIKQGGVESDATLHHDRDEAWQALTAGSRKPTRQS
jgi:hypothetical protein